MRVALFHFGMYKKGGWERTFSLAKGLAANGCCVTVITTDDKKGIAYNINKVEGINVIRCKDVLPDIVLTKGFGLFSFIERLCFAIFHSFEIVHADSHRPNSYYPCILNRYLYKGKFIIEWWDNFSYDGQLANKKRIFKLTLGRWEEKTEIVSKLRADGVVVLSQAMRERALNCGVVKNKIQVIHGGSDINNIRYLEKTIDNDNLSKYDIIFGFIGYGDSEINDLMPFFQAIRSITVNYSIRVMNFGKEFSQKSIETLGLEKIIVNCGWIDYHSDTTLLSYPDIYVLLKKDNTINKCGWPNKLGDYMACGRPIMLNLYGDLYGFVSEYPYGFIVVEYIERDIIKAIKNIINGNYNLTDMGKYNRTIAENLLSWNAKSQELLEFYRKIYNKELNR